MAGNFITACHAAIYDHDFILSYGSTFFFFQLIPIGSACPVPVINIGGYSISDWSLYGSLDLGKSVWVCNTCL